RFEKELGLKRPASTYHKFIRGLDGNKMSSSKPDFAIFLSDPPEIIRSKVMKALTGGRATASEQRKLGGEPDKCTIYELYMYYLYKNNEDLLQLYNDCRAGKILCGKCKRRAADILINFILDLQRKANAIIDQGIIDKIVEFPEF
ncbi:MAG: tryptophan--tRNA ligase, partial [Desulfurococcales archaeon]|nr:tryptophan--tRNA ligase [Desulfurococcales archaeon]